MLDAALLAAILAITLQLIPLPAHIRLGLARPTVAYEQAMLVPPAGGTVPAMAGPITVDRSATAFALFLVVLTTLVFWSARTAFSRGGVRTTARGVADHRDSARRGVCGHAHSVAASW